MSTSLPAHVTDDSRMYIETVTLTRDTDGPCTTECDSRDWSAQGKQENWPLLAMEQEPQDVCALFLHLWKFTIDMKVILFSFASNLSGYGSHPSQQRHKICNLFRFDVEPRSSQWI